MAATVPKGSVRGLLRSRMTRLGEFSRIAVMAAPDDRANETVRPSCPAAALIFEANIKSSTMASTMTGHNDKGMTVEIRAAAPFYKNGFVLACDETREAVLIDPGDEVEELLAFSRR